MDESRATKPDAEEVEDRWGVGARHFCFEDRLLDRRGASPPPFPRPVETEVAGTVQLSLEGATDLDQPIHGRLRITDFFAPRPSKVAGEPCAELLSETEVFGRQSEIH